MINVRYATPDGSIVAWETLDGGHASAMSSARDVLDYLAAGGQIAPYAPPAVDPKEQAKAELAATDRDLARVTEDLIDALTSKGIISNEDLAESVKNKLLYRKSLREKL